MKRSVTSVILFLPLLLLAEQLSAGLQSQLGTTLLEDPGSWLRQGNNYVYCAVSGFFAIYAVAGGTITWRASTTRQGLLLALLLGLVVPGLYFLLGPVHPFTDRDHAPPWLRALFWANWYMPVLASPLGALAVRYLKSNLHKGQNAA